MKMGSLFDGIGGFPLSALKFGIQPCWASEIEPFPIKVTSQRLNIQHIGDITKINGEEIEPVDAVFGGSPCQDLSVAGKRAGLAGARSGLYMDQTRIIKEAREHDRATGRTGINVRPRFMVWENVPGALSSNNGEDFRAVLEEAARVAEPGVSIPRPAKGKWSSAGCIMGNGWSIAWRILDAQYWGVPQRRRRIFLVADFAGLRAYKILFEREGLLGHFAPGRAAWQGTAADAQGGIRTAEPITLVMREGCEGGGKGPLIQHNQSATLKTQNHQMLFESHPGDSRVTGPHEVCPTAASRWGTGGNNTPLLMTAGFRPGNGAKAKSIGFDEELCPTLPSESGGNKACVVYCAKTDQTDTNEIGVQADKACTLDEAMGQAIAIDCRNHRARQISGTIQAKPNGGQSLNFINPVAMCSDIARPLRAKAQFSHREDNDNVVMCMAHGQANADITEDLSPTLSCAHEQPIMANGYAVRRLTPLECERLQGFPDGWTDIEWIADKNLIGKNPKRKDIPMAVRKQRASDSARYKALGNSVAIPCVDYVMEGIAIELREMEAT